MSRKYHPDNIGGDAKKFQEINEAYSAIEKGIKVVVIETNSRGFLRHETLFRYTVVK